MKPMVVIGPLPLHPTVLTITIRVHWRGRIITPFGDGIRVVLLTLTCDRPGGTVIRLSDPGRSRR